MLSKFLFSYIFRTLFINGEGSNVTIKGMGFKVILIYFYVILTEIQQVKPRLAGDWLFFTLLDY